MRTHIAPEPQQHAAVKAKAADLGITMAEYIRRLVDRDLGGAVAAADVSSVIASGDSGGSDIAADKHEAIAAAIAQRHDR